MPYAAPGEPLPVDPAPRLMREATLVFSIVFAACLFGILTRPLDFLAALWPANAILLGVLVRRPAQASPWNWLAATIGFVAADLATGGGLGTTVWLTAANLAGVASGYLLFRRLGENDQRLRRPLSVPYLFAICVAAATSAAIVGSGAGQTYFSQDWFHGFAFWFVTELANYIIILPVILTAPSTLATWRRRWKTRRLADLAKAGPILALVCSTIAAVVIGGPGAIAFPIPALLWCALSYSLFFTVVLTLLVCIAKMIDVSVGTPALPIPTSFIDTTMSLRFGITLLALGPLTVASINLARDELLRKLDYAVNHDALTDALTRSAFMNRANEILAARSWGHPPSAAVLMLDIDYFKQVNDRYGHAAGDKTLVAFASTVGSALRSGDILGRLGGEEFAVLLRNIGQDHATAIAERLRAKTENLAIALADGQIVRVTVSIGMTCWSHPTDASLEQLLSLADQALYQAKASGRNQVRDLGSHAPGSAMRLPGATGPT